MHTISPEDHHDREIGVGPVSRRLILAGGLASVGACATATGRGRDVAALDAAADIETYVGFGQKNAGSAGDAACGSWIESQLERAGFQAERHPINALEISERDPSLQIANARVYVSTHTSGATRAFSSITAPVRVWGAFASAEATAGAIIVAHLPNQRWSSAEQPAIRQIIERASYANAAALVLVTNGPTRELIKLNRKIVSETRGPVALISPREWSTLDAALRQAPAAHATLTLNAAETPRPAFNVVGRLDRGATSTIIVSTPRSGWTACAGERGPGVAVFLALARWAPTVYRQHNLLFLCTSAHEFENAGNAAAIEEFAPAPDQTALWLHLGAGFAARDWHESGGQLAPLPSADAQRFLVTTPNFLEAARSSFAGVSGLESPYSTERGASGELQNIIAAGYTSIAGMLGAHRFHHVAADDMSCVDPQHTTEVISRVQRFMANSLPA